VHQRYKLRRSIVITSNRVVQDWGRYLGDATMATTLLDRLMHMHRCEMLEFEGKLPPEGGRHPHRHQPRNLILQASCLGEFGVATGGGI
jgi:hypothetical protein